MYPTLRVLLVVPALACALAGCRGPSGFDHAYLVPAAADAAVVPAVHRGEPGWAPVVHIDADLIAVPEETGPYTLDSGDRLRVFVYGQPNLSRLYTVDSEGRIAVPLIGEVSARGRTPRALGRSIANRLSKEFVKDPHVTVDIAQYRPFFILGEVRSAGQYPFVSGLTVQSAVAIAGGFADRANERSFRITRRHRGHVEKLDVPSDYLVRPGDEIYVNERWF